MCLACFHAVWSGSDASSTLPLHVGSLGVCGMSRQAILQEEGSSGHQVHPQVRSDWTQTEPDFVGTVYQDAVVKCRLWSHL
jgi:hypothetical protein